MKLSRMYLKAYEEMLAKGLPLYAYSVEAIVGYYLQCSGNVFQRIKDDIIKCRISALKGQAALIILQSIMQSEEDFICL